MLDDKVENGSGGGGAGDGDGADAQVIKLRGLPFSTTVSDVLSFLSGVDVVGGASGVHLTEMRPGRPSGECFVEVATAADIDLALTKDKQNIGKRYIEVFVSDAQEMGWALAARDAGDGLAHALHDDAAIIKLRGLPFGCSRDDIAQFLHGLQVSADGIDILYEQAGRATGEAFVHLGDKGDAARALERDREKMGHRYIEVFLSSAQEVRAWHARDAGGGGGGGRVLGGRGFLRHAPYDRNDRFGGGGGGGGPRFSRGRAFRPDMGWGGRVGGGGVGGGGGGGGWARGGSGLHSVHMRGLPFKATQQDIAYFFKPVRPVNINILYDNNNRPSGEADVDFASHEDAVRAMRRDKCNMEHRYIELFLNSAPGGGGGGGGYLRSAPRLN